MHKAKDESLLSKVALLVVLTSCMASATVQASTTVGAPDCGQWVTDKAGHRLGWLVGFLSGMNLIHDATGGVPKNPLSSLKSVDQAFLWMDNWCKTNPLKDVSDGGMALFLELMRDKK